MKCCMIISVMSLILSHLHARSGGVGFTPIKGSWAARQVSFHEGHQCPGLSEASWRQGMGRQLLAKWHLAACPSPVFCSPPHPGQLLTSF